VNILVVCDYKINPDRIGGMDRFFKLFDESVKSDGHQITWVFADVIRHSFYNDVTMFSAEKNEILQFTEDYLKNSSAKVDVLITHFVTQYSPYFKRFKKIHQIKKIFCVDHNPRPLDGFPLKKRIKKRIKGFLYYSYIDKVIGVSEYTSKHSIKDFGTLTAKKTKTIYNGIDPTVFKNKKSRNQTGPIINFIVVSHLRHSKGIQDLLLALDNLSEIDKKKLAVTVFGSGPYEETLKNICKQYKLENIVTFKGSSPDIHLNLYQYDYMLQPTHMECFSLSILESLLSNVPVITTRVGGNAEVIVSGKNGWLFEATDVEKLTEIIENIISRKNSIKNDIYKEIEEKYSLELMVENHIKLLDN
jgi:glycosyltransferase involved in cell wall biosynthesis